MNLSIVIPAYNFWKVTGRCLVSIFKSNIPCDYKILFIDDCSTDQTPSLFKHLIESGKPVKYFKNESNMGYPPSVNVGFKNVDTSHVLLLNNDIILDETCISELLDCYTKYPNLGMVGGEQLDVNREQLMPLKFFKRGDDAMTINHITYASIPPDMENSNIIYCDDLHFSCVLFSKEVLDKVGLLDERFGKGNYEQEDYCLRVKDAGYQVGVCPRAKYIHFAGTTTSTFAAYYSMVLYKNREYFFEKWGQKLKENKI